MPDTDLVEMVVPSDDFSAYIAHRGLTLGAAHLVTLYREVSIHAVL